MSPADPDRQLLARLSRTVRRAVDERVTLAVKGKGEMRTFILESER